MDSSPSHRPSKRPNGSPSVPTRAPMALALALAFAACAAVQAQPNYVETPIGKLYVIMAPDAEKADEGSLPTAMGDTFSFHHNLTVSGSLLEGTPPCLGPHMSGMDDNTVLFDGLSEALDAFLDGTLPQLFEFESTGSGGNTTDIFMNAFADTGEDLFPEGFLDPDSGEPLDAACLEIGIDDTLDFDQPSSVTSAIFEASDDNGEIIPPTDITSLFSSPWNGRATVIFDNGAGQGINGLTLDIQMEPAPFDSQPIFADGFESGDATSWNDSSP